MASLLARLSWRGKKEVDGGTRTLDESSQQRSSSTRSRKSMSSLFRRPDSPLQPDCQERAHYPLYDPSNPEHHGPLRPSESSIQGQLVTPKKSRLQSIAQSLQDALRTKASYFHIQRTPDSPVPSPSSSISKKSVRFREGHFVIGDDGKATTSPLTAPPQNPSPRLPKLNFSQTPLLQIFSAKPLTQEDLSIRCSPKIFPVTLPPPLTTPESPFDDIYATEDLECENQETPHDEAPVSADIGNSAPAIIDEGGSNGGSHSQQCECCDYPATIDEVGSNGGSHSQQCECADCPATAALMNKSNSLPLRKCRVEIGKAEVYGVAAVPRGLENVPVASRRDCTGRFD